MAMAITSQHNAADSRALVKGWTTEQKPCDGSWSVETMTSIDSSCQTSVSRGRSLKLEKRNPETRRVPRLGKREGKVGKARQAALALALAGSCLGLGRLGLGRLVLVEVEVMGHGLWLMGHGGWDLGLGRGLHLMDQKGWSRGAGQRDEMAQMGEGGRVKGH